MFADLKLDALDINHRVESLRFAPSTGLMGERGVGVPFAQSVRERHRASACEGANSNSQDSRPGCQMILQFRGAI